MEVFVLITRYMNGVQESGVFASFQDAGSHLVENKIGGRPEVIRCNVIGELTENNTVFTASSYDLSNDIHNFQGVYGSYDLAKNSVGDKGLVLSRTINSLFKNG